LSLQDSEQPKKKQKAVAVASHESDVAAAECLDLAADHHDDAIVIKQEHFTDSSSVVAAAAAAATVAAAAPTAAAAAAQHAASQQKQQQQPDTVSTEQPPAAAAQGMPDVDVTLTVNTTQARKEIAGMLLQCDALGAFISQLWSSDTDTLQKFVAVIRTVLDTNLLPAEQQQRVSVLHLVLSHGAH
jgi:hypothetical protein